MQRDLFSRGILLENFALGGLEHVRQLSTCCTEPGHIVIYADADCGGESTSLFDDVISLYFLGWNDRISSIVVVSGSWQCYRDNNYGFPMGPVLTPGIYNRVTQFGIDNDSISSLKSLS